MDHKGMDIHPAAVRTLTEGTKGVGYMEVPKKGKLK